MSITDNYLQTFYLHCFHFQNSKKLKLKKKLYLVFEKV